MIARRSLFSVFLLTVLTAALRAAPGIPSASTDPKEVLPPALQPGAGKSPTAGAAANPVAPASIPVEKKSTAAPATVNSAAPATTKPTVPPKANATTITAPSTTKTPVVPATNDSATTAPAVEQTATDAPADTPAAPKMPAVKPGILSAAKAKGPPPVGKTSATPVPLSPRFQQTRTRMGALFDTRNAAPAPTDPLTNPFRPAGALPVTPLPLVEGAAPVPVAINNDLASLQQAVATLRVKGTFQRGKSLQLVITSAGKEGTYKEGDVINVLLPPGDPVHLRVRQVSKSGVTLTLGDAEMVLKF